MSLADRTGLDTDLATLPDRYTHPQARIDALEIEVARFRQKAAAYDAARATVKTEGNTRAFYVLRAEAAERELARLQDGLREIRDAMVPYPYSPQFLKDIARALLADTSEDKQ